MKKVANLARNSVNWKVPLKSVRWSRPLIGLLLITLVIMSMMTASAATPTPRVQPVLLELAAQQPDALLSVIIQQATNGTCVRDMVLSLGGEITKDLDIINAFAAIIPAKAVPQLARAEEVRWVSLDARVQQTGSAQIKFTTWANKIGTATKNTFKDAKNIPSPVGKNGTFASGSNAKGAFGGFAAEYMPGYAITKVEVALRAYSPNKLGSKSRPKLTAYVSGKPGTTVEVDPSVFKGFTGPDKAGMVYIDITSTRPWHWSDFGNNLQVEIDQTGFAKNQVIFYDSVGLRVTTTRGKDSTTSLRFAPQSAKSGITASGRRDTSHLQNAYNQTVRATNVWNEWPFYNQGQGVTVAVIDSGVLDTLAFDTRLIGQVNFDPAFHDSTDRYGHGTFVAGLIGDNGSLSTNQYVGIAPQSNILSVRISDDEGISRMSDVVNGLQWVLANKAAFNIRVVNLSLNSAVYESYMTNPLDAAVEILWFDGLVVVVSGGNNGSANLFPPANDPFVITVGATDDKNTVTIGDDTIAPFSAWGTDETGGVKPDLVAPGTDIVAYLPDNPNLTASVNHPQNRISNNYFLMSGTSMAAPLVAGSVALLLRSNPFLTPDQVKYRLESTANKNWPAYDPSQAGAGLLDIYAAVHNMSTASANTGIPASQLLWSGGTPVTWSSVNWSSVNWSSVNWSSVNWSSVNWSSVNWSSDYWR